MIGLVVIPLTVWEGKMVSRSAWRENRLNDSAAFVEEMSNDRFAELLREVGVGERAR